MKGARLGDPLEREIEREETGRERERERERERVRERERERFDAESLWGNRCLTTCGAYALPPSILRKGVCACVQRS